MITIYDFADEDNPIVVIIGTHEVYSNLIKKHLNKELIKLRWIKHLDRDAAYLKYMKIIREDGIYQHWQEQLEKLSTMIKTTYSDIFDEWMYDSFMTNYKEIINRSFDDIWNKIGPRPKWLIYT